VNTADTTDTTSSTLFEEHRAALLGAAYRIVGTRTEAEDVLQDAWLRWRAVDASTVADPRSYMFRLVTNAAIDQLRRARVRREAYVGPWLPEPVATEPAADAGSEAELAESLSVGLLLVLESLAPAERAVFVLHEAFGFPYAEVATMLGRTEHAVRQLAYRARTHVRERRARYRVAPGDHRRLVRRFTDAALGGDMAALLDVLAPGVVLWADADGRSEMPRHPLRGAEEVAAYLTSVAGFWPARLRLVELALNHGPGVLVLADETPFLAFAFEADDAGRLAAVHAIRNPDKLEGLAGPALGPDRLR
jgi:RNA polymerase sigma-70 factor (ECF subfamily)